MVKQDRLKVSLRVPLLQSTEARLLPETDIGLYMGGPFRAPLQLTVHVLTEGGPLLQVLPGVHLRVIVGHYPIGRSHFVFCLVDVI